MEVLVAVTVGVVFGSGLYLVMQRNMLRFVFGLILISGAVNVSIFVAGRLTRAAPPLIPADAQVPAEPVANALPQALILTAIVIGFGLVAFALVLLLRTYERLGTVRTDEMVARLRDPRPVRDPHDDSGGTDPAAASPASAGPEERVDGTAHDDDGSRS